MADYENPAYSVTINQGTGDARVSYTFKFDETLRKQPINSFLNKNGVYCGENAPQSVLTSYSTLKFDGLGTDIKNKEWHLLPHKVEGTCNMRIFGVWQTSLTAIRTAFRWTGLDDDFVTAWNDLPLDYQSSGTNIPAHYNPLTNSSTGTSYSVGIGINTIYQYTPLLNLKFRSIILYPVFHFVTQTITRKDNGYLYFNSGDGTVISYSWADIKPADKTPKGRYYDDIAPLFTNKYRIVSTSENSVTIQYCAGVTVTPYIGESNKTYNPQTDSYGNETGEVVYGDRQSFAGLTTTGDSHPAASRALGIAFLCEYYVPELNSVIYATPAGVMFAGYGTIPRPINQSFAFGNHYQTTGTGADVDSVHPYFNPSLSYMTHQYNTVINNNINIVDEVAMISERTEGSNPYIVLPGTHLNSSGVFSSVFEGSNSTAPTSANANNLKQVNGNVSEVFPYMRGYGDYFNPQCVDGYTITELWATIAGFGVFVAADLATAKVANLKTIYSNNHLYCGYMDSNFVTNGTMMQGDDISSLPQTRLEDLIRETPYKPVSPITPPTPGGEDDPENPPSPSGKSEAKITGDDVSGVAMRDYTAAGIQYYQMTPGNVEEFVNILWGQPKSFYDAIQIAGRQNTSIFDYIASLRAYPFGISTVAGAGSSSKIFMGTGAEFKKVDGTEYNVKTLPAPFVSGSMCVFSLDEIPGWRNNFLDYSPYTKLALYLPYAGTIDLDTQQVAAFSEISTATLRVEFAIDFTSGTLTYFVRTDGGYLVAVKNIKVGVDMPVGGNDNIQQSVNMLRSTYDNAKTLIGGTASLVVSAASKNVAGLASAALTAPFTIGEMALNSSMSGRAVPVNCLPSSGSLSATYMGQSPFLTVYRQKIANPSNYGHAIGYKTESTHTIGEVTGWTIVRNPDLTGINATEGEKQIINEILTTGFYA